MGVVRDGEQAVTRAMVTALGEDGEGPFGIGIRAKPTDEDGRYELIGLRPGSYFFQVARFGQRPQQASLSVEVPEGVAEVRVDLELPQSSIAGRVIDSRGEPVAGITVAAGTEGGAGGAGGLLGMILRNGVNRARTAADGTFELRSVAAGSYRLTTSARGGRRGEARWGEAAVGPVAVDGRTPVRDVLITVPLAGSVRGVVRDGNGAPVAGAEIGYVREDVAARQAQGGLEDLFGVQRRPVRSAADGTFALPGLTPGSYAITADLGDRTSEPQRGVAVAEAQESAVELHLIRGATVRVRVRNVDGSLLPSGTLQLLDGRGEPLTKSMSALSIFRRLMGSRTTAEDTGWREFGSVPPDTYTVVVREDGKPEQRFVRAVRDGETVEWDIDMAAALRERR